MSSYNIGSKIQHFRKHRRLTQGQLAEIVGCSDSYVSQIERDVKKPSYNLLTAIANALQVSLESLISQESEGVEDEKKKLLHELNYTASQTKDPKVIKAVIEMFNTYNDMKDPT